jgi:L-ascorbate metabolism protein UlaG (beta-lactamase superfamily)
MIQKVYLRQNVIMEPLFNQWYAWLYLIYPATAAMFIANSHLKIMRSFITSPHIHMSALKNPEMIGGPFINYDAKRSDDIKALMNRTIAEQAHMLEFAEAVSALDQMLDNEATGYTLEPLYKKIPEILRGYVELVYDLHNHASIRFIEGLLYKSRFYNETSQSIMLSKIERDDRPFTLSTPRLDDDNYVHLRMRFSDDRLDELFKMRDSPRPFVFIKELLGITVENEKLFSSFFTEESPQRYPEYTGDDIRIRYFGHACLLIETKYANIICDPVLSYTHNNGISRYSHRDLPDNIDYVLITHNHQDHCMLETLLQMRHRIKKLIVPKSNGGLADPSLKLALQSCGFRDIVEIDEMEVVNLNHGTIQGLPFPGEHADLNIKSKISYLVCLGGKSILIAADSNNIDPRLYEHIYELTGDIDILFLGMECDGAPLSWLYGPLLTQPLSRKMDQSRRFDGSDYEKGLAMIRRLRPEAVYIYAMGQEPWLSYISPIQYTERSLQILESNRLIADCKEEGIAAERLFGQKEILIPGEWP